ncbi:hypothetical protein Fmac_027409 [Flemingia macrophylla]|uniref:Transcription repressor n=1 Tax=Flemingia macrophylla TaxID=520843 RepID=A0ABD1LJA0_9FABA
MSSSRRKVGLNTVSVSLGCGSCRGPKLLGRIFHPRPRGRVKRPWYSEERDDVVSGSSSTCTTTTTTTKGWSAATFSPWYSESGWKTVKGLGRAGSEGVAVEKESEDPYLDFRQSMLQMILQNEIYSKHDLRHLLNCFLQLNSPDHHPVIVRAFTEIWNAATSSSSATASLHPRHHFFLPA